MEIKKAKITKTVFKNEWNNPKGDNIFYHDIELDSGDKGSIGTKEKEPAWLNPGQELSYTIETGEKGNKIKRAQENNFKGGGYSRPQQDPRVQLIGFSHAYAKDLCVAGKIEIKDLGSYSKKIFDSMVQCFDTIK